MLYLGLGGPDVQADVAVTVLRVRFTAIIHFRLLTAHGPNTEKPEDTFLLFFISTVWCLVRGRF